MLKQWVCFLMFAVTPPIFAAESAPMNTAEVVKSTVTAFMQKNAVPGVAVTVYVNGKPESYYFGSANEAKKIPVSKETIFEIGSITKLLTSLLLAQEVDAAKMQYGDSVSKYLPMLPSDYEDITLLNLATHTSGLPFDAPENIQSETALVNYLKSTTPEIPADVKWIYSNFGIGLLGMAIEKETHKSIDQLYKTKIFMPLHMTSSGLVIAKKSQRFLAEGHDANGQVTSPVSMPIFASAAAMKMSALDAERFLSAAIGLPGTPEQILYPIKATESSYILLPTKNQGLGWLVHKLDAADLFMQEPKHEPIPIVDEDELERPNYNGDMLIDKTGGTRGFRSYIAVIPNKKTGIVIFANKSLGNSDLAIAGREILFTLNHIPKVKSNSEVS